MSQQTNIAAAFLRIINGLNGASARIGTLGSLNTTAKTSVVAALNEVLGLVGAAGAAIDDAATASETTWSSTKISSSITSAIAAVISGAPGSQDTLAELAAQITALAAVDTELLSVGGAQTFTTAQKLAGCQNLGIGDPEHNYVTAIETALATSGL